MKIIIKIKNLMIKDKNKKIQKRALNQGLALKKFIKSLILIKMLGYR